MTPAKPDSKDGTDLERPTMIACGVEGDRKKRKTTLTVRSAFRYGGTPDSVSTLRCTSEAGSSKTREAPSQYIARSPLSLKKISIQENGEATVISYTSDNNFFKGKIESFPVMRFLLELTQHIPRRIICV